MLKKWNFWIDRGGTFTDIVAHRSDAGFLNHKLLSENPEQYPDAAIQGIRDLLGIEKNDQPWQLVANIRPVQLHLLLG